MVEGDATAWLYVCERTGGDTLLGGEAGGVVIRRSCDMEEIGVLAEDGQSADVLVHALSRLVAPV